MQGRELSFVFQQSGAPPLHGDLLYSLPGAPSSAPYLNCAGSDGNVSGRHFSRLTYNASSTEPDGLALVAGDASVDSWFREIHVPRA